MTKTIAETQNNIFTRVVTKDCSNHSLSVYRIGQSIWHISKVLLVDRVEEVYLKRSNALAVLQRITKQELKDSEVIKLNDKSELKFFNYKNQNGVQNEHICRDVKDYLTNFMHKNYNSSALSELLNLCHHDITNHIDYYCCTPPHTWLSKSSEESLKSYYIFVPFMDAVVNIFSNDRNVKRFFKNYCIPAYYVEAYFTSESDKLTVEKGGLKIIDENIRNITSTETINLAYFS